MIRVTRNVVKRCPFKDEVDYGTVTLTFPDDAPELHQLAEVVDELGVQGLSHEGYTSALAALYTSAAVSTEWTTGPWSVVCEEP